MSSLKFNNDLVKKYEGTVSEIRENLEIKNGSIVEKEGKSSYEEVLKKSELGLDMETIKKIRKFDEDFLKSCEIAFLEKAAHHFNTSDDEKIVGKVELPSGKIVSSIYKSRTYSNNFAKEGEDKTITKNLVIATKVDSISTRGISSIRDAISKEYEERFMK